MDSMFSLHWDNYNSQITEAFRYLFLQEELVDVTLSCEGKMIKAHKMLLSACSPYFHEVFKENPCQHPVIVLKNVQFVDLKSIVDFIYNGEVNMLQEQLESFINTAQMLEVKGLTDVENEYANAGTKKENKRTKLFSEQLKNSTKISDQSLSASSDHSRPPAKKRKLILENPRSIDEARIAKSEPEDIDIIYVENSNPLSEDSTIWSKRLHQEDVAEFEALLDNAEPSKENSTKDASDEKLQEIEEESITQKGASPEGESKTLVPLRKNDVTKVEQSSKNDIPIQCEKKTPIVKSGVGSEIKRFANENSSRGAVQIQKSLKVTLVKAKLVEVAQETYAVEPLRSEDATAPVNEQGSHDNVPLDLNAETEPDLAEEAPSLQSEKDELEAPAEEEPKEPEFDYFGCEICQTEAKTVDLERIVFSHKCPICPCSFFCSHLLKEHMKIIHGWFNVQRRFTKY